jgi:tetratricopeptide (TPR) repeat protein
MYFENLSDPADSDNLGRMLTSLLTTELSRSEGLDVVSSQRLYDIAKSLGQEEEGMVQRSVATQVAEHAGVGTMVLGQITKAGERFVATTELVNVGDGKVLGSPKAEGRSVEEIFTVAESLGQQVRQVLQRPTVSLDESLASRLTESVEAYSAYVRGETFLQRQEFDEAAKAFREAVRIDPEFALAYYQLRIALSWFQSPGARDAAEGALLHLDKLPPAYQDVVRAWASDSNQESIELLERALVRDPHNKAALQALSDRYLHGPKYFDLARSVALMEDLLAIDPDFSIIYEHLATGHVMLSQTERAREWIHRWEPQDLDSIRASRAFLLAREKRFDEALRVNLESSDSMNSAYRGVYAMLASRWDLARIEISSDPERHEAGALRTGGFLRRGSYYCLRGALDRSEKAFRRAALVASSDSSLAVAHGAVAHQSLAQLVELKGDSAAAQVQAESALAAQPECPRCLYLAGVFALRNKETGEAEKHLETLTDVDTAGKNAVSDLYLDALQAEMDLEAGKPEQARELFEGLIASGRLLSDFYTHYYGSSGAAIRDGMAGIYIALGEKEKAVEVLEALLESGWERVGHPVLYVRALYTLGVLSGELGDDAKSREYFERFLEHWGDADWDLAEVRDARARLQS